MLSSRRHILKWTGLALALSVMGSGAQAQDMDNWLRFGKVFTSTNAANNELLVYSRDESGALKLVAKAATNGQGTGAGLGSQGAVTLSQDGRFIFVVNAHSNTVTTFALHGRDLRLMSVVDSGGLGPVSVTEHEGLVYVLNAQGAGNIAGFRNHHGTLTPVSGSHGALSASGGTGPAQVGFSSDGDVLVVTEKATNKLVTYRVKADGGVGAPVVTLSAGATPFGFAFDHRDHLIVSEAVGGAVNASTASSYKFTDWMSARPTLVSGQVATTQTAACWVAITPNGKFAYTTNAGSGSVSSFAITPMSGRITLSQAVAGTTGAGSAPIDAAVSADGRSLYVLGAKSLAISSFEIQRDGQLISGAVAGGLPVGTVGLAAN
ncbi:MAG: beta-propeller fold lactonase family protein [Burkholderiales bacterium]|nr:beta-propeller fold lactonase family protein [Burkholderiales bacterium]